MNTVTKAQMHDKLFSMHDEVSAMVRQGADNKNAQEFLKTLQSVLEMTLFAIGYTQNEYEE